MSEIDDYLESRNWRKHPYYADDVAISADVAEAYLRENPHPMKRVLDESAVPWCFDSAFGISQYDTVTPFWMGGPGGPTAQWLDDHPPVTVEHLPEGRYWVYKHITRWPNA